MLSSVQSLSCVLLFATPWIPAPQASLSISNSESLLKLMSIKSLMLSNHLIFHSPFSSHLQSFPGSGSFQISQLFASGGQSIGVSASTSVLPMNTQDWSPLEWTGWISLQSKGLSRVFSTVKSINFSVLSSVQLLSHVWLFTAPWTVAWQSPLSIGFFRQEYWTGLPFPPPGDLPNPGIQPGYPASPALAGGCVTTEPKQIVALSNLYV